MQCQRFVERVGVAREPGRELARHPLVELPRRLGVGRRQHDVEDEVQVARLGPRDAAPLQPPARTLGLRPSLHLDDGVHLDGEAEGQFVDADGGAGVAALVAEGLDHPRVIYTLPNGDVIVAEADSPTAKAPPIPAA